jgi:general stress protein 26
MAEDDHVRDRVWEVIERVRVCMMTTTFGGGLRARPLEARPDRKAGLIWFVIDVRGAKDDEIERKSEVGLTFIDPDQKVYLSLTCGAEVRADPAKAAEIWRKTDTVWWPLGPSDPNVRVLRVEPHLAECWDGPSSSTVARFEFLKARITGEQPDLGQNRKATVRM